MLAVPCVRATRVRRVCDACATRVRRVCDACAPQTNFDVYDLLAFCDYDRKARRYPLCSAAVTMIENSVCTSKVFLCPDTVKTFQVRAERIWKDKTKTPLIIQSPQHSVPKLEARPWVCLRSSLAIFSADHLQRRARRTRPNNRRPRLTSNAGCLVAVASR